MEQNDIVAQIMAMIQGKPQQMPMIANKQFPAMPPPQGIMPQPIGMPKSAQTVALESALGMDMNELGQGSHPDEEWAMQNVYGRDVMGGLPPEILEMVLQGRIPQPGGAPAPGMLKKMNSPSGTMSSNPGMRSKLPYR